MSSSNEHKFSQAAFDAFVIDHGVVGFFEQPITLKSGRKSSWYVNWRTIAGDAYLLDELTDHVVRFIRFEKLSADCIYGVPEGATKAAVLASLKWAREQPGFSAGSHAVPMGRAKPKEHGDPKDRYFVGEPKGRTLVLEDVTTTGGSLIETVDRLLEAGISVVGALSLTNRMEKRDDGATVEEYFKRKYADRVPYLAMSSATDLLPLAVQKLKPSARIVDSIRDEFAQYGAEALKI